MKRGFTLIELLAVIVILSIIALIAIPIVLGIIKDTKEESNQRSIEMYARALKNSIMQYQLGGQELKVNKLEVKKETGIQPGSVFTNTDLKVDYDGNVVCNTIIVYEDGDIYLANCEVNKEKVPYTYGTKQRYEDGDVVYFNIKEGKSCDNYHEDNSKTGYNGINGTGNQNSCLKFYAFLDDGGKTLNLLLDHNTSAELDWNSSDSNTSGPAEAKQQLYEDTKGWNGTQTPSDYKYNHSTKSYTIEYSKIPEYEGATTPYKARLIEANEIAQITGADKILNWKEEVAEDFYHFYNLSTTSGGGTGNKCKVEGCKYKWLYDRTHVSCIDEGCSNNAVGKTFGYWTSSVHASYSGYAWYVFYTGRMDVSNEGVGVRPVIEVLKSDI